ncbi:GTPase inhibitor [Cristinia sonorae]|uniref:GTPase inhibitor n=1 Tax=Cristinia sonorae TaxID=1940300 RepID=A0A8K0UVR2_9AGAR|nr:GTPase inhibitor [Cristinia sonorae]
MAHNSRISELSSRLTDPIQSSSSSRKDMHRSDPDEDDDEAIFAELEAEIENDDNAATRERGMLEMKREVERLKSMREGGHGRYDEIMEEKEVIHVTAREPTCVVHFYHTNFKRCQIMDGHLAKIAPKYFSTRFLRVFVENVPWLVEKLGIKVLPCVVCFVNGTTQGRIVGFDELGGTDDFDTASLEWQLLNIGVVQKPESSASQVTYGANTSFRQQIRRGGDDDSDFDLDDD